MPVGSRQRSSQAFPPREAADGTGPIRLFFSVPDRSGSKPAVFLDRDGVINVKKAGGYVTGWPDFSFVPGIVKAVGELSTLGLPLIVISNQAGVGKRIVSRRALIEITRRFVASLRKAGGRIDAVYYCPHTPSAKCSCRKPNPGLLEEAARDWGLDLANSVLIGDSPSDITAAVRAGCGAIAFRPDGDLEALPKERTGLVEAPAGLFPAVAGLLAARRKSKRRGRPSLR